MSLEILKRRKYCKWDEGGKTGFMAKKRREAGLGAIKADVVEKLKIGNRMQVYGSMMKRKEKNK